MPQPASRKDGLTIAELVTRVDFLLDRAAVRCAQQPGLRLRQVLVGERVAMASVPLFVEYEAVMSWPEHLKVAGAVVAEVRNLLDVLASVIVPVEIRYLWRPQLADADDDMVLECAANGGARHLVTFNVADFTGVAERFAIKPLTPGQMLKET